MSYQDAKRKRDALVPMTADEHDFDVDVELWDGPENNDEERDTAHAGVMTSGERLKRLVRWVLELLGFDFELEVERAIGE